MLHRRIYSKKWKHPSIVAPSKISISRSILDPIIQFVGVPSRLESFLKDLVEILAWDICAECHFGLTYKFQVWLRIMQLSSTLFHLENEVLHNSLFPFWNENLYGFIKPSFHCVYINTPALLSSKNELMTFSF